MNGIIYKATNITNGKSYIGITTQTLKRRIQQHISQAGKNTNNYFHNTLNKYGKELFEWEILDTIDNIEDLKKFESWNIDRYNTKVPNGYNLTNGGDGIFGYKHTDETKLKMSISTSGINHHFYGKKLTDEHRSNISSGELGKEIPKNIRKKISKSMCGTFNGTSYHKSMNPERICWRTQISYNGYRNVIGWFLEPISGHILYNIVWDEIYGDV